MKAALKTPGYLVRNPYSFCFRMIVPKDLRKFVGKTELRYTLRTGNLRDGKHKAKLLAGQVQFIFRCLKKEHQALGKLSDDQVKQLVHLTEEELAKLMRSKEYINDSHWHSDQFWIRKRCNAGCLY